MKLSDQIKAALAKRGLLLKSLTDLSTKAATDGEGRNFTEAEQKTFDDDKAAIAALDAQIDRLKSLEADDAKSALLVPAAPGNPAPTPNVEVVPFKTFPGQALARFVGVLARSKGNIGQAVEFAKRFDNQTPEVGNVLRAMYANGNINADILRAAVASGTAIDATWAAPLVNYQVMVSEFVEFLRPQTILGKLTGYRPVPFNVLLQRQTAGYTAQWVGEGAPKPIGALAFDTLRLPWAKMALISVITDELARLSNPSAELMVRNDLAAAVSQYMDQQFIDPAVAAVANVKPGAITNVETAIASSGYSVAHVTADLSAAMLVLTDANIPMAAPVWIMHTHAYQFLITQRSSIDTFVWKDEMLGGKLMGIPFIVSNNVPIASGLSSITLFDAGELLLADDGQMLFDASSEASLQMDSAPTNPPVAATVMVSMFQQNMLAIKVERYIYWLMRRPGATSVVSITGFPAATA